MLSERVYILTKIIPVSHNAGGYTFARWGDSVYAVSATLGLCMKCPSLAGRYGWQRFPLTSGGICTPWSVCKVYAVIRCNPDCNNFHI